MAAGRTNVQKELQDLEFVSDQERTYFGEARLGEDVIAFLNSAVGRYLHGCAKQEIELLRDELEKLDPENKRALAKIKRIQQQAAAARYFRQWCAEAINNGEAAYSQLVSYREEST